MIVRKDRQYLIFDFEDGQTVQYDLAQKITIGKLGKPVKDLKSQLRGYSISQLLDCFENKQYGLFLKFVQISEGKYIQNFGTIIERAKKYSRFEQLFSSGIQNIDSSLKYGISDIPAGLLKLCKEHGGRLTNTVVEVYKSNPDMVNLAFSLEYVTLEKKDIWSLIDYGLWHKWSGEVDPPYIHRLMSTYGYTAKSLLLYLDHLKTYEALDNVCDTIRELYDYASMMKQISGKFEKYPRNFLTTHRISIRNYNRLKQEFIERDFACRRDETLEFSYDGFKFIYPKTTQEIKDEAVQQGNCVASYIQNVIDGKCHILFMRKASEPDKSLVTIEIRNGMVVQAKGKFNREVSDNEQTIIDAYNKRLERKNAA